MPTIWRAPRSSACAPTAKPLRAPPETARARSAQGSECTCGSEYTCGGEYARGRQCACRRKCARASSVAAADHDLGLAGRRAPWSGSVAGTAALRRGPQRTAQPRPPKFRSRARSICVPKLRSLPCANARRRLPKTRCRPPSRSSTRCCRSNSEEASCRCARDRFARLRPWAERERPAVGGERLGLVA